MTTARRGGRALLKRLCTPADCQVFAGPNAHLVVAAVDDHGAELFDRERESVAGAVPARVLTFSSGRHCARQALMRLGHADACLPRLESGAADWPAGIVGSISHSESVAAAVVARADIVMSVGIDIEHVGPLDEGVQTLILNAAERHWLSFAADPLASSYLPTVLFSLKESLFKCLDPLARSWFGFDGASIDVGTFDAASAVAFDETGALTVDIRDVGFILHARNVGHRVRAAAGADALRRPRLQGRVLLQGDHVLTMVVLSGSV